MAFKQADRLLQITKGPLSETEVILTGLSGREAMSRLYSFQLEFVSSKLDLKASDLIAQALTIEIARHSQEDQPLESRFINGYISRLTAADVASDKKETRYRHYRAELVPWLWFLTQTARCYIYFPESEDKTIYNVIEEVFNRAKDELGIEKASFDMKGIEELKNRKVKHCVQYRETDFNFVSRIMEQYGVYYYFTQKDGEHKMVLDMSKNYPKAVESKITFPRTTGNQKIRNHITGWEHAYEFVSGKWTHTDYDFENPSTNLRKDSSAISVKVDAASKFEVYDYPGEYTEPSDGKSEARLRQEESELPHDVVRATSLCSTLMPGHTFELDGHPDDDVVSEHKSAYLITTVHHHATQPGPDSSGEVGSYSNSFSCSPDSVQFRPARITPKPVVSGIQTAVVVGLKGEEIHTDKYGRIKVAFHWDREDDDRKKKPRKKVDNGEMFYCWVRVAQNIAGNRWGFMAIPRIGQEVVVDFIEGDPDRPLVVGSVYNQQQMPHYDPEQHKTRTYIKTNSSPGGDGHNELRFEDKKDEEQIYIHAERDMDVRVKNDSLERIYGHRHQIIGWEKDGDKGGDQREEIKKDKHLTVHGNQTEQIGGDMQLLVGGIDGDGNQDVVIKKDKKLLVEGDRHTHVLGDDLTAVDGNLNVAVGGDHVLKISGSSGLVAGKDHLMKGINISVEGQAICLKSGGNSITIDPSGITITGTLVRINSGPAPPVISQAAMIQSKSPEDAAEAEPTEPSHADDSTTGAKSAPD